MHPSTNAPLNEWLQYIEAIHPLEIDLGLDRLKQVAERLLSAGHVPFVYTVAGTNGKGTTTAALNSLAMAAGETVGWYSSPHLLRFNERIQINGQQVGDDDLVSAFEQVEIARQDVTLSYFEFTTLAALYLFSQKRLSVWVLEVGLGGRLDAVNIIDPDVAVITTVGLDHQAFLGSTLDSVGREKAGICREGRPLVLGSEHLPASVFSIAKEVGAEVYPFSVSHGVDQSEISWQGGRCAVDGIRIPLPNAAAAVQAFSLADSDLSEEQISSALRAVKVPGRLQPASYLGHPVVVDVGHNPHAAEYIAGQLAGQKYHLVAGMLSDKDAKGFIGALEPVAKSISFISLDVPRGLSSEELKVRTGCEGFCYSNLLEALTDVHRRCPGEPIFVGGSFYTVVDALALVES